MRTFAAAGLIAAAAAVNTEATPTPSFDLSGLFDSSKYYSYGAGAYAYPEFDHKEELTPVKTHPSKPKPYKTNNIDIFAHSSSSEDDHHGHHGYGYGKHHSSHSSSDTSEDEIKPKKHHRVYLTGNGPEGEHCHEGDYCGKDSQSDYSDSDYSSASEESEKPHFSKPDPGCGGELCARVDFDWNIWGLNGTMDIYQPRGHSPKLLFDADFDFLQQESIYSLRYPSKFEVAVNSLPVGGNPANPLFAAGQTLHASSNRNFFPRQDKCEDTGSTFDWIGTTRADDDGNGHLRTLSDGDYCLEDIIGRSVEIRGRYEWALRPQLKVLACGNIVPVACPPSPEYYF